jgi:hypothetical protein
MLILEGFDCWKYVDPFTTFMVITVLSIVIVFLGFVYSHISC